MKRVLGDGQVCGPQGLVPTSSGKMLKSHPARQKLLHTFDKDSVVSSVTEELGGT